MFLLGGRGGGGVCVWEGEGGASTPPRPGSLRPRDPAGGREGRHTSYARYRGGGGGGQLIPLNPRCRRPRLHTSLCVTCRSSLSRLCLGQHWSQKGHILAGPRHFAPSLRTTRIIQPIVDRSISTCPFFLPSYHGVPFEPGTWISRRTETRIKV